MILVFNSGSSSLKFALFDSRLKAAVQGQIDWAGGNRRRALLTLTAGTSPLPSETIDCRDDRSAARAAFDAVQPFCPKPIAAIGHRVVHGGLEFRETVLIDAKVRRRIAELGRLAPLHNPPALRTIAAAAECLPDVPQAAVFDTSFYRDLPEAATLYAIPYEWHKKYGLRRFGFHGLSHQYCAMRAAELLRRRPASLRIVTCHLGGGCSATAVRGGKPVASTIGYSPLEGLIMGTRCGSVDPGLILSLQREHGVPVGEIDRALNYSSGLLGISGLSPDHAQLEKAARAKNERARLALTMFHEQLRSAIAGLAASMNGADAIVFTERIGEHSAEMRKTVCEGLGFMGVALDLRKNARAIPDVDIASAGSKVRVLVIHSREELMVARETARALI